jgi:hypothetical protein
MTAGCPAPRGPADPSATTRICSPADPDGVSAQIDLIGVPCLMIGEEPSSAPNGGSGAQAADWPVTRRESDFNLGVVPDLRFGAADRGRGG